MSLFLLRRALAAVVLVFAVASAAQLLAELAPGDFAGAFGHSREEIAAQRHELGLDRPMGEQYVRWLKRTLTLDLGESFQYRVPVFQLVVSRGANTARLAIAALIVATLIGIPSGIFTGSRGGWAVRCVRGASLVLLSVPPLISSLVLLTIAARTGWLPVSGMGGPSHYVVPTLALALPVAAMLERLQSQSIADTLRLPSTTAARARGIPDRRIVWRHGWRQSLGPVLAIYGVIGASLFSGSFAVEIVTTWPGLGDLMRQALMMRDTFLVAGCAAAGAAILAAGVLAADVAHAMVDPRIRGLAVPKVPAFAALALLVGLVAIAPSLAPYNPARQFSGYPFAPPMRPHLIDDQGHWHAPFAYPVRVVDLIEKRYAEDRTRILTARSGDEPWFLLGSDSLGRDVLSRLLTGARQTLGVALLSTIFALAIGAACGAMAGYAGGWIDSALMRIADLVLVLPGIYLVLALRGVLPLLLTPWQVFGTLVTVLAFVGWPSAARGVRGIVLVESRSEYAEAARALGAGSWRLMARHLLPAARGFLGVQATVLVPSFIIAEATLSFVGLGFREPTPSWGAMLLDAAAVRTVADAPWLLAPAGAIVLTVLVVHTAASTRDPLLWDHNPG